MADLYTHDCTRELATRYTTTDTIVEIGSMSATDWNNGIKQIDYCEIIITHNSI